MSTPFASNAGGGDYRGGSQRYNALDRLCELSALDDRWTVEYIWLGGNDGDLRSKTRTIEGPIRSIADIPDWNFDGSSTNQAPGIDSEVLLRPRKIYRDPFRASSTDRQVRQQELRRRQFMAPFSATSRSAHFSPSSLVARKTSRGPAEAALASTRLGHEQQQQQHQHHQQMRSDDNPFTAADYEPLALSDAEILEGAQKSSMTASADAFSTQRVSGLTTDGGDDLEDLLDDVVNFPPPSPGGGEEVEDGDEEQANVERDHHRRRSGTASSDMVLDGCRNLLVMCDTYAPATMNPLPTNTRAPAEKIFNHPDVSAEEPWFGIEQEYTLLDATNKWPIGWPPGGYPAPQGPYYCGVGADRMFGRGIAEAHYTACHFAGLDIGGLNAEVMPGQWEFQVGPCVGVDSGDQLWVARYILQRVCELTGNVVVTFDPKPVPGDWNGAGAHTNYSTRSMREVGLGGIKEIERAIERLKEHHEEHIARYGTGNERRLTGKHETAAMSDFTWGIADRGASIRVGNETFTKGAGYMEDRRPSANMDPYVVTSMLASTTLLSSSSSSSTTDASTTTSIIVAATKEEQVRGAAVGGVMTDEKKKNKGQGVKRVVPTDDDSKRGNSLVEPSTPPLSSPSVGTQTDNGDGSGGAGNVEEGEEEENDERGSRVSSRGGNLVGRGLAGAMAATGIGDDDPFLADDADSSASSAPVSWLAPHSYTGGV